MPSWWRQAGLYSITPRRKEKGKNVKAMPQPRRTSPPRKATQFHRPRDVIPSEAEESVTPRRCENLWKTPGAADSVPCRRQIANPYLFFLTQNL